jgi:hypothetical protein
MKKVIAILAAASLGFVGVCFDAVGAESASAAPAKKPPKGCVAALEATERLVTASSQVFSVTADFLSRVQQEADKAFLASGVNISTITTFLDGIKQGEEDLERRVVEFTGDLANARRDHTTAAAKCLKGK